MSQLLCSVHFENHRPSPSLSFFFFKINLFSWRHNWHVALCRLKGTMCWFDTIRLSITEWSLPQLQLTPLLSHMFVTTFSCCKQLRFGLWATFIIYYVDYNHCAVHEISRSHLLVVSLHPETASSQPPPQPLIISIPLSLCRFSVFRFLI